MDSNELEQVKDFIQQMEERFETRLAEMETRINARLEALETEVKSIAKTQIGHLKSTVA